MSDPDALLREALVHAFESLTHIYGVAASHSDYADAVREIEGEATAATDAILTALAATPPASAERDAVGVCPECGKTHVLPTDDIR